MGIINLPVFESTEVERRVAPQENPAFQGMAAAGNAQARLMDTLFKGATGIAGTIIDAAKTNQMNKATIDYLQAQQQQLLDLEKNPVTSVDPRYAELSDQEKLAPNLAIFNKWKADYTNQAIGSISIPAVKQEFKKWLDQKGLGETESLAKFDIATSRAVGRQQLAENLKVAEERGDRATVLDLVTRATGPLVSEAEANEAKSRSFENITSRELYMKTLTLPVAPVPETRVPVQAPPQIPGMMKTGNIDLNKVPVVRNPDGSFSTVNSISISVDSKGQVARKGAPQAGESTRTIVLIPTIGPDGRQLSEEEAIAQYRKTGMNLGTFKDQASADAYAKAVSATMSDVVIPAQESGLEFLADRNNLKYVNWDGKVTTVSLGEQENLINKYKVHLQEVRIQRDTFYSDVHIRADSLEKIDQALGMLAADRTLSGTQKYDWEVRFNRAREYYLGLLNLKGKAAKDAHDDYMKANEDELRGRLAIHLARFPNDTQGLRDIISEAFDRPDRRITGKAAEDLLKEYSTEKAPEYKLAMKAMADAVAKLPADRQWLLTARFDAWYRDPSHKIAPKDTEVQAAIKNLMEGYLLTAVDSAFPGYVERYQTGGFIGNVEANMKGLEAEVPLAVKYANQGWPEMNIRYGFIDKVNDYGFGEGAAILKDGLGKAYAFKMDGKQLKLYTYVQTDPTGSGRKGGQPKGDYIWQEVTKAPRGGLSKKEVELRGAEATEKMNVENWKKTPDRYLGAYGVEHDAEGGWFMAGEQYGKRNYLPPNQQQQFDQIWKQQGGQ